jgi:hypothetical protein
MASRTFDVSAVVPVSPEDAIAFLLRLDCHRGLHAYVQTAERVAEGTDAAGDWADWRVAETPRLGPFRYTLRFRARMTRTSPSTMTGLVHPGLGATMATHTVALPADGGAHVTETVTVTAARPLVGYMERQARIAHERMFALLPGELGRG